MKNHVSWWSDRSRKQAFILTLLIFSIGAAVFLFVPNKGAFFDSFIDGAKSAFSWAFGALVTLLVLTGPLILGFVMQAGGMRLLDRIVMKDEDMSETLRFFLMSIISVVIGISWMVILPASMTNPALYGMFVDWGLRTSWEVVPWNWAGYAMFGSLATYALTSYVARMLE